MVAMKFYPYCTGCRRHLDDDRERCLYCYHPRVTAEAAQQVEGWKLAGRKIPKEPENGGGVRG